VLNELQNRHKLPIIYLVSAMHLCRLCYQTPCNNSIKRRRGWHQEGHPAVKHSLQQTRMRDNNKEIMPHRLSHGERRGAFASEPLTSIRSKWTTVVQTHSS